MDLIPADNFATYEHQFSDGIYCRTINIPAGIFMIGAKHLTNHMNVLLQGEMLMTIADETKMLKAPCTFEALAGSIKAVITKTDCKFMNIIRTDLTNIEDIEKEVVDYEAVTKHQEKLQNILKENLCLLEQ